MAFSQCNYIVYCSHERPALARHAESAPEGVEIEAIEPVERMARAVQALELALANSREEDANDNALKAHP